MATEQPLPVGDEAGPSVQALVRADLVTREEIGRARYGQALFPFNGRSGLRDLYEELLDGACYARQVLEEMARYAAPGSRPGPAVERGRQLSVAELVETWRVESAGYIPTIRHVLQMCAAELEDALAAERGRPVDGGQVDPLALEAGSCGAGRLSSAGDGIWLICDGQGEAGSCGYRTNLGWRPSTDDAVRAELLHIGNRVVDRIIAGMDADGATPAAPALRRTLAALQRGRHGE